jgi:hypothetical protein
MTRTIAGGVAAMLLLGAPMAQADAVLNWNAILTTAISTEHPFAQARYAAIAHLAIFEAVNAIDHRYRPYLGTVTAPGGASPEAAAVAAAYRVLVTYFPSKRVTLDASRTASLATIPNGWAKDAGIAVGEAAAIAMLAARADDGATSSELYAPHSSVPGQWQITSRGLAGGGLFLHWRNVTPFGIDRPDQFRSAPPPKLASRTYARDFNEVRQKGAAESAMRSPHKTDVARFYAEVPAPLVWNSVLGQVAAARRTSFSENARSFALLNMAMSDAAVAVFDAKYHYNLWRPETAIHGGGTDGNPKTDLDPYFTPLIEAPGFPSYPSGHASLAGAAQAIAELILGKTGQAIRLSTPALPGVVLQYAAFKDISDDIDDARVYGGIHFRFDQTAGRQQGRRVGEYIYGHYLRPTTGG